MRVANTAFSHMLRLFYKDRDYDQAQKSLFQSTAA
jgi:hypothetical protein